EVLCLQVLRDRAEPVVAREAAADLELEAAEVEVALVVHHEHFARLDLVEARGSADRAAGIVHERLGLEQRELVAVDPDLRDLPRELRLPRAAVPAHELVGYEITGVVPVARVFAARVAEPHEEQVERRPLAAGPEPHEGLALGRALVARGVGRRLAGRLALGRGTFGRLALDRLALFALGRLGLDDARRR